MLEEMPPNAEIGPWRDFEGSGRVLTRHMQNVLACAHRRSRYMVIIILADMLTGTVHVMGAGVN